MINQLIKMLKFEYRLNYIMWLYNVAIAVVLITTLMYFTSTFQFTNGIGITLFITCIFTINSYQESTTKQAMQMYHQIPISGNVKFISKQIITLIGFPLTVLSLSILAFSFIRLIFQETMSHESFFSMNFNIITAFPIIIFFVLGIPLSTFFAILFKKNKILYSIVAWVIIKTILGTGFSIIMIMHNGSHPRDVFGNFDTNLALVIATLIVISLYAFSYRQFFRRQL